MKINKHNPLHWYYLALQGLFTLAAILLRPFLRGRRGHIIILYGHHFSGHLAAIYSRWRSRDMPDLALYFLSLHPFPATTAPDFKVDLLLCRNFKDMLMLARASAMITDHGLHLMRPLLYFTDILFIDVGHGIPFKGYDRRSTRLRRRYYSEIWTSSHGVSDIYAKRCGCGGLVHSVGSARTDRLVGPEASRGVFREHFHLDRRGPVVLYAPTWQQDDKGRSLLPFGQNPEAFLEACSSFCRKEGCYFVFRSHQNASFPEIQHDRVIFCPQSEYPDTEDILLDADILISDWSSIVFDFLVLDRPTVFLDVPHPFAKGCTLGPEFRFGRIVGDMTALLEALTAYIKAPRQYMNEFGEKHRAVKSSLYDDNADGHASDRCLDRLESLLS